LLQVRRLPFSGAYPARVHALCALPRARGRAESDPSIGTGMDIVFGAGQEKWVPFRGKFRIFWVPPGYQHPEKGCRLQYDLSVRCEALGNLEFIGSSSDPLSPKEPLWATPTMICSEANLGASSWTSWFGCGAMALESMRLRSAAMALGHFGLNLIRIPA
jgi:hypothetical protein